MAHFRAIKQTATEMNDEMRRRQQVPSLYIYIYIYIYNANIYIYIHSFIGRAIKQTATEMNDEMRRHVCARSAHTRADLHATLMKTFACRARRGGGRGRRGRQARSTPVCSPYLYAVSGAAAGGAGAAGAAGGQQPLHSQRRPARRRHGHRSAQQQHTRTRTRTQTHTHYACGPARAETWADVSESRYPSLLERVCRAVHHDCARAGQPRQGSRPANNAWI